MKPGIFLALLLSAAPLPALAETILHLSEQASVTVTPDELAATLKLAATGTDAAQVQGHVNTMMTQALTQARAVAGVVVNTGSYQVWRSTGPDQWNGEQSLELHGKDGAVLLKLIGALQGQGAALSGLGWRVAPETARTARNAATKIALGQLRGRADAAAAIIGLRFASFRDVRLDGPAPYQPTMPRMMSSMAKSDAAPNAESEPVSIEATVSAEVVLQ